jgi:hypothetical protein
MWPSTLTSSGTVEALAQHHPEWWTTVEKKDSVEVLVVIVIAVLVLGVAIGPLLAMRNPAEADKLAPGADPAGESSKEPDASESSIESPTPRHTEDQP